VKLRKIIITISVISILLLLIAGCFNVYIYTPTKKTAFRALYYFWNKDYTNLYELNHSVTKKAITIRQLKDYVDTVRPVDLGEPKSYKTFLVNNIFKDGYCCLTFDIELIFDKEIKYARIRVAKDKGRWSVLSFTFGSPPK